MVCTVYMNAQHKLILKYLLSKQREFFFFSFPSFLTLKVTILTSNSANVVKFVYDLRFLYQESSRISKFSFIFKA